MRKLFYLSITILLLHTISVEAQSVKIDKMINNYLNVAFNDINGLTFPLTKWENVDTIKYFIVGNQKYLSEKKWNAFLSEIEIISNLHFHECKTITNSEILIYIGDLKSFFEISNTDVPQKQTKELSNWSSKRWNSKYQLLWTGFCIVPDKVPSKQIGSYYLKKLFLKSLGMVSNSENEYSIYFRYYNYNANNSTFSRADKRLLKLHYNETIKAGMTFQEVKLLITEKMDLESLSREKL
ncbi:MAG: DUF2927 domain-containing protein [Bacteroidales bacterium]|nr:DUF2927 domain-containing protein [Bacteroidales bacterium]